MLDELYPSEGVAQDPGKWRIAEADAEISVPQLTIKAAETPASSKMAKTDAEISVLQLPVEAAEDAFISSQPAVVSTRSKRSMEKVQETFVCDVCDKTFKSKSGTSASMEICRTTFIRIPPSDMIYV